MVGMLPARGRRQVAITNARARVGRDMSLRLLRVLAISMALATTAFADAVPGFELERFAPNPGARETLGLSTGDGLAAGSLRVSLLGHYERDPLVFTVAGVRSGAAISSRVTAHVLAAWAFTDWAELSLSLPIVAWQQGDDLSAIGLSRPATTALGAPWLTGRFTLLRQSAGKPLDLAVSLGLGVPLGSAAALTRDPGVGLAFAPSVGAGRALGPVRLGANLGATVRGSEVLTPTASRITDEVGPYFSYGVALSTTTLPVHLEATLRGEVPFTRTSASAELLVGVRVPFLALFEVSALGGPGFGHTPGTPAWRALLGLAWTPSFANQPPPAPVCVEGKPYVLKDCPALDLDGDGVANGADRCPSQKGVASQAGCPDVDGDGDGVMDLADACPAVKGLAQFKGCPPPDSDGDGLDDLDDHCPKEPGPLERQGCPVKDQDHDGLEDDVDACPTEKGVAELKGCPDRDTDGDGVVDRLDNCPKEAGPADNQGCPKANKQLVVITADKIVIKDKVFFATGKSQILARSFGLLKQVASVLASHPELTHLRIEGHTDDRGAHEANVTLSQSRADAVKAFLEKAGVATTRLEAKGFGPDRPADTNSTEKGRENNRRVEFLVVQE